MNEKEALEEAKVLCARLDEMLGTSKAWTPSTRLVITQSADSERGTEYVACAINAKAAVTCTMIAEAKDRFYNVTSYHPYSCQQFNKRGTNLNDLMAAYVAQAEQQIKLLSHVLDVIGN